MVEEVELQEGKRVEAEAEAEVGAAGGPPLVVDRNVAALKPNRIQMDLKLSD